MGVKELVCVLEEFVVGVLEVGGVGVEEVGVGRGGW